MNVEGIFPKATMVSQAIDTMMAYQFIKSHPRSNGKIGTNGHSRGGTNSLLVADVKFTCRYGSSRFWCRNWNCR